MSGTVKSGTLVAIWIKRAKRGPMDAALSASLVAGRGIAGNANQGGRRQVTLIEEEAWAAMMGERDVGEFTLLEEECWAAMMGELAARRPTAARRATLVVRALPLLASRGRR